jgi:hypothetical protein
MTTFLAKLNAKANDMKLRRSAKRGDKLDDASLCSATSLDSSMTTLNCSLHSRTESGEKTVTFKRKLNKTFEVEYICDIDSIEDHWYSAEDLSEFRARDKSLAETLRNSSASHEEIEDISGDCTRGLEREKPEAKRRIHAQKRDCYAVVLKSDLSSEEIASSYGRASRSAIRDATIIARLDAMAASSQ